MLLDLDVIGTWSITREHSPDPLSRDYHQILYELSQTFCQPTYEIFTNVYL